MESMSFEESEAAEAKHSHGDETADFLRPVLFKLRSWPLFFYFGKAVEEDTAVFGPKVYCTMSFLVLA